MKTLDRVNNLIGTFYGASAAPPAGTKSATITADIPTAELTDASNQLRVGVEADFGLGFKFQGWSDVWVGHAGATAPSVVYNFDRATPLRVRGVLENFTQVIAGLFTTFN